ncbi:MAG: chemotaxis-specific protein-glutamate methyltransferase CheB [Frankia sp.]|nr:chemotaxis-specific protein-glutamate methyltransferase CheB [Frankia sp.]
MADGKTKSPARGDPAPAAARVGILIAEGSVVQRRFLRKALETHADFEVIGEARNGREAVSMVERLKPAAVLMDLELPVMSSIEAIERIMASRPTPIVVYSASGDPENSAHAMEALAAGAVDVVAKPAWGEGGALDGYANELRRRLRVASRIRVITHPRGRLSRGSATAQDVAPAAAAPAARVPAVTTNGAATLTAASIELAPRSIPVQLVAIGASTGGPQALAQVLGRLPRGFAPAVLVVQHMAEGFIPGLVQWLGSQSALKVVQGQSGRRLMPGEVTVAPSGLNLLVRDRLRVVCEPAPERQFHVPGIDASFTSIAESVGAEAVGVLLTGMGRDGAAGLKDMRDRGAVTIGQDELTSAVYGMPAAAQEIGAVEYQLPLGEIAPLLRRIVSESAP